MELVYVFDAYCGWSYGFALTMVEIGDRFLDLPVEVVSAGLFTGARRVPIRELGSVQDVNTQITQQTGVQFGAGYEQLIADGSFVMDSEAAARGMAALRRAAPDRAVELAAALQKAFFVDGLSLSATGTYREIALRTGLDGDAVVAGFVAPAAKAYAATDFRRARRLGIESFPTLLAVEGDRTITLAIGHATTEQLVQRLTSLDAVR